MMKHLHYILLCSLAHANFFADAAFTDKAEIWRLEGWPSANALVAKWHRPGGGSNDVVGTALDLNLCLGSSHGKLAWAKGGMAMDSCDCSLTSRLWPGGDATTAGFESAHPANGQLELSDYQRGEAGKDAAKAILSCRCTASMGPVDATIDLDEGIELKDGKLSCVSAPGAGTRRRRIRRKGAQWTPYLDGAAPTATANPNTTVPAAPSDLVNAGCRYFAVSAGVPGKSTLEAHCPTRTPAGGPAMYTRLLLDLDQCIANNGGVPEFQRLGKGGSTCKFSNTTNAAEWAYDCGGAPGRLGIAGRFTVANDTLGCFPDQAAPGRVPLDWACRDLRLSADAPGTLVASCPAGPSGREFATATMDLNRCLGINPRASGGGGAGSTVEFWPQQYGNALENCRLCSMWNTTISGVQRFTLNCNCRHGDADGWPEWATTAVIGEHIFFNPRTLRPTCIGDLVVGHRMTHNYSMSGHVGEWLSTTSAALPGPTVPTGQLARI